MQTELDAYRQTVLDLCLRLPDTPRRLSRHDLRLVRQFWEREIPLRIVETAFLLASARRGTRDASAHSITLYRLSRSCSLSRFLNPTSPICAAKCKCVPPPMPPQLGEAYPLPAAPFKFLRFYMHADII